MIKTLCDDGHIICNKFSPKYSSYDTFIVFCGPNVDLHVSFVTAVIWYIDGLAQNCSNSIANKSESLQFCSNHTMLIWDLIVSIHVVSVWNTFQVNLKQINCILPEMNFQSTYHMISYNSETFSKSYF